MESGEPMQKIKLLVFIKQSYPWGKKWSVQISQYWETLSLTLRSILDAVLYDACVLARQAPAESEISLFVHQQTAVLLADVQSSSPPRQMLGFVQESYKIWGTRPDRSRGSGLTQRWILGTNMYTRSGDPQETGEVGGMAAVRVYGVLQHSPNVKCK